MGLGFFSPVLALLSLCVQVDIWMRLTPLIISKPRAVQSESDRIYICNGIRTDVLYENFLLTPNRRVRYYLYTIFGFKNISTLE